MGLSSSIACIQCTSSASQEGLIWGTYVSPKWDFAFHRYVKERIPNIQLDGIIILSKSLRSTWNKLLQVM